MANKFGTVDNALWRHKRFHGLSDDAKLMFVYLKTCSHQNMIGCYYLPKMYAMNDLKWTERRVDKTLSELFEKPFAMYCEETETIFLPKHLELHPLQNLNQAKGAAKLYGEINNNFIHINHLAKSLLESKYINDPVLEGFRKGLERVSNDITVSVTVSEPVTEPVTPDDDAPQAALELDEFDVEKSFESFWGIWPKRGDSRKPAFDKYKTKVKDKETAAFVLDGLRGQLPQFARKENKFIPAAATWLNQERWNNEPEPPPNDGPAGGGNFNDNEYGDMRGGLE